MSDNTQNITVIGPDTHIKGEMHFDNTARILGSFEGRVVAKGEIQIGESACCQASIEAEHVIVDGQVDGDITAHDRVQLNDSARVTGDLVANTLVVAEGASFIGQVRVGENAFNGEASNNRKPEVRTRAPLQRTEQPTQASASSNGDIQSKIAGLEARLSGKHNNERAAA